MKLLVLSSVVLFHIFTVGPILLFSISFGSMNPFVLSSVVLSQISTVLEVIASVVYSCSSLSSSVSSSITPSKILVSMSGIFSGRRFLSIRST